MAPRERRDKFRQYRTARPRAHATWIRSGWWGLPATAILAAPVTQVDQWGLTKREKTTHGDAGDVPQRGEGGRCGADGAQLRALFDHGVIIAHPAAKIASQLTDR